jgi:BASS family bile acid:Na+ symporter
LGLLAVVITPVTLSIFYSLFDLTIDSVGPVDVATQVIQVTFIPVIVRQLFLTFAPDFTARIRKPVAILANLLLVLLVVGVLYILGSVEFQVG